MQLEARTIPSLDECIPSPTLVSRAKTPPKVARVAALVDGLPIPDKSVPEIGTKFLRVRIRHIRCSIPRRQLERHFSENVGDVTDREALRGRCWHARSEALQKSQRSPHTKMGKVRRPRKGARVFLLTTSLTDHQRWARSYLSGSISPCTAPLSLHEARRSRTPVVVVGVCVRAHQCTCPS
jgi:hypothetical protein